jgi:3-oxoadipyl-CoA thiolase
VRPWRSAASRVASTRAAAPSLTPDALPAVTVPSTFAREIVAVEIPDRKGGHVKVERDEHPRADTTAEGEAQHLGDRGEAVALGRLAGGEHQGGGAVVDAGPIPAVERLCARLGLKPSDFDAIELNEAFASQALAPWRSG